MALGHGSFPRSPQRFYVPLTFTSTAAPVVFSDSVDEVVTTVDTQDETTDFVSALIEATTLSDTTSAIGTLVAAGSESVSTADIQSALALFLAAIAESTTSLDTQDATVTTGPIAASVAESVTLADTQASTATFLSSVLEAYSATDLSQAVNNAISSIAESIATTDSTSDVAIDVASISEIISIFDLTDATTGGVVVYDVDVAEALSMRDFLDGYLSGGGKKRWKYPKAHKVRSSNIDRVAYDKDSKNLAVKFKTDKVYNYSNVEPKQVKELRKSKSPGGYLHSKIIGNHPTVKMR